MAKKQIPKPLNRREKDLNNFKIEIIKLVTKYKLSWNVSGVYDLWNEILKMEKFYTQK